ncbi:hypothetical protein L798_05551 [Zootermopsis nevadensis]|uniref:Uncharacterized protein n=1 Tax=Zootermopsis nevadensis TaxID=136037 RepID=A0A067R9J1_ZOONE|nr:hypothetical protein L798_05551 [Zootermopsis nevadensis]
MSSGQRASGIKYSSRSLFGLFSIPMQLFVGHRRPAVRVPVLCVSVWHPHQHTAQSMDYMDDSY